MSNNAVFWQYKSMPRFRQCKTTLYLVNEKNHAFLDKRKCEWGRINKLRIFWFQYFGGISNVDPSKFIEI